MRFGTSLRCVGGSGVADRSSARVRATITEWENRLKIAYDIVDAESGTTLTRAHTIQVAVDAATNEMLYLCPPVLWERLGVQPQ